MLSADKVSEIFCIADDFCQEFDHQIENLSLPLDGKKHRRRKGQMSDSEIMTILICFHFNTYRNFKHYYLCYVKGYLKEYFPNAVCHNKRIKRNKVFKGYAAMGKSTMGWFYGFKLHLICNERGELINFMLTKGNVDDRSEAVFNRLTDNVLGKIYADKGYISETLFTRLYSNGIHLVTGLRSNMKNKLMSVYDKIMLRKRSVIETVNDELKNVAQAVHSRHRSVFNFAMNMLAALAAYCFFDKKPAINCDFCIEGSNGQLTLFN